MAQSVVFSIPWQGRFAISTGKAYLFAMSAEKNPIPEIEVTPEMIAAGAVKLYPLGSDIGPGTAEIYAEDVLRAALAVAPRKMRRHASKRP